MLLTMFCVFAASSGKSAYQNLVLGLTQPDCFATMRVGADNTTIGGQTAPLARLFHALKVSMGWMSQTVRLAACPIACYQHPSHPMPLIRQMVDVQNSIGSMKMSTSISSVAFNGTTLTLASINNKPYVAIKPICDAMGIDWNAQFQKIKRDLVLNSTMCITHMVAEDGKQREMVCLPLEYLNGWLFKIDARRVRNPQAQVAVVQYQRKCYPALNNYWNGKAATSRTSNISGDLINLKCLCSHMTWLNGWWSRYQDAVRGFNRIVAASVHDHFNDGAFVAAQFIGKYSLDVVPSKVARNFPWDANDQEKHDYYTLTRNEKR